MHTESCQYIAEHPSTAAALAHWRPETKVITRYFWKLGGGERCSIKGVWCSLAYQILTHSREQLVDGILDEFSYAKLKNTRNDASLKEVEMVSLAILRRQIELICIFIDGLDEISDKDGVDALKDAVSKILPAAAVGARLCLASLPEPRFDAWLQHVPGLKLHDLTRQDMLRFVEYMMRCSRITLESLSEDMIRQIRDILVFKAEGVFLWLALATNGVIEGLGQVTLMR